MFTTLADFLLTWESESVATRRMLEALTDDALNQAVTINDRNLGRIAWHIVTTVPEMMSKTGLVIDSIHEDAPVPNSAETIADNYRQVNNIMVEAIKTHWNDQTLLEEREMYGESWKISKTLLILIVHQIHHRGQMTVLMRQADLKVPGIYGPSREEWSDYGMEAPPV